MVVILQPTGLLRAYVKYMMDQLEEEVKEQKVKLAEKDEKIAALEAELAKYKAQS